MKVKTQHQWVKERLLKNGYITRNQALKQYITRLSAIIWDLREDGNYITGEFVKTKNGRDYKYTITRPF